MIRFTMLSIAVVASLLVSAPLYYSMNPEPVPELPPPGRAIRVADGTSVNAIDVGPKNGSPLVLVHGLPGSGYDWNPLTEDLAARGHRVIAYDRVGYARSDARSDGDFTLEANARELLALLEAEQLSDATVLGWSYGGGTAITAAKSDASRIGRLVLIGSAGPIELEGPPPLVRLILSGPVLRWIGQVPPMRRALQESSSGQAFSDKPLPSWWLPQLAANFAAPHTSLTWQQEGDGFAVGGLDPAPIERPILVIHGDDDRLVPLEIAETLQQRARDGKLLVVEDGSHMLPVTHPALLGGWVTDFVAAKGGGA